MNWFDNFLRGIGVPNIAGEQNKSLDQNPAVQAERAPNGSFDPSRLGSQLGADAKPGLDYINSIYDMQRQQQQEAMTPPTRTGLQFLGQALSAASVPVAFAQGNREYGMKMTGNTEADRYNQRVRDYEDQARQAQVDLSGQQAKSYGDYGLNYLQDRREKTADARKTLANILAAGRGMGGISKSAFDAAKIWANTNGFQAEWDKIASSVPLAPDSTGVQPSPDFPAGATDAPAAPDGGPVMPTSTPPYITKLYEEASIAAAMGDKGRAEALMAQANDLSDIWKKEQESKFSRQTTSNSTLVYGVDEKGDPVVMQPSSTGELVRSKVPAGVRMLGPEGVANVKQMGKDYATRYKEVQDSAAAALDQMNLLNLGGEALATGVYTGLGGEAIQGLQKLGVALGVADKDTIGRVAGGELIQGIQNRMALLMRTGGQMPGALSDNDIKFLQQSQFGIDKTPEANRQMLIAFQKMAQRKLDIARLADEYVQENGQIDAGFTKAVREFAEANPLFPAVSPDNPLKKSLGSKYGVELD